MDKLLKKQQLYQMELTLFDTYHLCIYYENSITNIFLPGFIVTPTASVIF